ncbi:MAG: sensor domain-containing protein [Gulosibacter sp.]|uniref:sensor domain-containing protein n=1 Tax=Gulosibacter sp. TaxID=2817531 RepID=UPI003F90CF2C
MLSTRALLWTIGSVITASVVVGGVSGWALTGPLAEPNGSDSANGSDSEAALHAVPEVFIGNELEALLLTDEEVASLFPETSNPEAASPVFWHAGESEGATGEPATCFPLIMNDAAAVVGARHQRHETALSDLSGGGDRLHQYAMQYADISTADRMWEYYVDATSNCTEFNFMSSDFYESTSTTPDVIYTQLAQESREDVEVIVGSLEMQYGSEIGIYAHTANTVVRISMPQETAMNTDPEVIANTLADRLETALQQLEEGSL